MLKKRLRKGKRNKTPDKKIRRRYLEKRDKVVVMAKIFYESINTCMP